VMQHVWKDAFPGRTDQKGGSAVNLTHPMCEIDFISIKVSFHGFVISIRSTIVVFGCPHLPHSSKRVNGVAAV
jgi:hypothetical protein